MSGNCAPYGTCPCPRGSNPHVEYCGCFPPSPQEPGRCATCGHDPLYRSRAEMDAYVRGEAQG